MEYPFVPMISGRYFPSMGVAVCLFGFVMSTGPVLAETAFDSCMRTYAPPPGPTYGFMAAQAACQAVVRTGGKRQRQAAVCVAGSTRKIRSPKQFDSVVERCYGRVPVHPQIKFVQCLLPNYMKANSQEKMNRLVQQCQN